VRFRDPLSWDASMREQVAAVLLPSVVEESIAQSSARDDRGMILYDQKELETIIYYVAQGHSNTVLWMADDETKQEVADIVATYNPQTEATIVMVSPSSLQVMWVREDGAIQTQGAKSVNALPVTLPEGVTVATEETEGVYAYCFTHAEFGDLGRIRLVPSAETGLEFQVEVAPGGTETEMQQKRELFEPIAQSIVEQLDAALKNR